MGWCGGTEIFDNVIDTMISMEDKDYCYLNLPAAMNIVECLYKSLIDQDWDNIDESKYYDTDWVRKSIKRVNNDIPLI